MAKHAPVTVFVTGAFVFRHIWQDDLIHFCSVNALGGSHYLKRDSAAFLLRFRVNYVKIKQ